MTADPRRYKDPKQAFGMPEDEIASNTTDAWSVVALLKSIADKLGVGGSFSPSTDVAQGSTTAGQTGGLTQAAVTTAAPAYATAKTNPLSLKTNGDLRVADTDAATILAAIAASVDGLEGATDGLEGLTGALTETAPATDTASSGLNGRLQRVAQRITSLIALVPASLGGKTAAASLAVTTATDDPPLALLGAVTETAPATDTASSGLNGRLQRIAQRLTALIAQIPATLGVKARTASLSVALSTEDVALFPASLGAKAAASSFAVTSSTEDAAQLGSLTETAPATDTASSGLNGRLQRIAQRITSLIALVPTSLGTKTAATSFAVTLASDDALIAPIGIVTETAPATDTASSGLNGRLQRIAQRITSLIALVPASLGQKAMSASFAVTLASDDPLTVLLSASSASVTALASAATSAQLLAANAARKGLILNNTDANAVLVKYGTTASATSFTVRMTQNGYWEMPKPIYTGRIDAIWEADGSGSLYATEL